VEYLIIAPDDSQRATQFQQFLASQGHSAACGAPRQRVPAAKQCWLGAVFFEGGPDLPAQVRAIHESLRYLGIPLAAVAAVPAEARMQVQAAGAELLGDPALSDAQILQEMQSRCLIEPLAPDVRRQLAGPLVTAVEQTLSQMADAEVTVRSAYQRGQPTALGDLSVTLTLSHSLEGLLILSFSKTTADALARRILADAGDELDPVMVTDCMGEIGNIIAGQAKALFHGTSNHFVFSTPSITIGQQGMKFKEGMTSLVIAFESEKGAFALQLCR
jgi:chemotaxis protein CheX